MRYRKREREEARVPQYSNYQILAMSNFTMAHGATVPIITYAKFAKELPQRILDHRENIFDIMIESEINSAEEAVPS